MMIGSERGQRDERTWIDLTLVPLDTDAHVVRIVRSSISSLIRYSTKNILGYYWKLLKVCICEITNTEVIPWI